MLRKIFEPTRDEVTGGLRKFKNEELCNCSVHRISRDNQVEVEMGRAYNTHGAMRSVYKMFV